MTNPLQGTLENRDGAWVLTLVRRGWSIPTGCAGGWEALRDKYSDALGV
jgi:hypothetical protein